MNNKQRAFSRKRYTMYPIGQNVGRLNLIIANHYTYISINSVKLYIDTNEIAHSNTAKYLGMTLDAKIH